MHLIRHLAAAAADGRPRAVAIGTFDGVHRGHVHLLSHLDVCAAARDLEALVVLRVPTGAQPRLTTLRSRLALLAAAGVARVACVRSAEAADDASLAAGLGARLLVTGRVLSHSPRAVAVECVAPLRIADAVIGSAGLRDALRAGDLAFVRNGLGRDPSIEGRIVHGFHRGAQLGIPTANLRVRDLVLPPDGVYAVRARLAERALRGVANIGFNPTFDNRVRSVETHLFDFDRDVYGQRLEIAFVARLRGEQKFAGVEALLAQIRADIATARALFAEPRHGE